METIETSRWMNFRQYHRLNKFVTALIFVVAGVVILGHNMGWVKDYIFRIIISWPMLLIVIGLVSFMKRNLMAGFLLLCIGVYFILPRIPGIEGEWLSTYWPTLLILAGVVILFRRHKAPWHKCDGRFKGQERRKEQIEDGFVVVDISFGNSSHIVMDPVFRGADLDASFGSISLDLRRTSLEAAETYIDIDCSFSGIIIFIPSQWTLKLEIDNTFGGCDDKRYVAQEADSGHKLIIRGDILFGGLEIKN
ncbi:MAG: cell wall-active antibiotics response protein [Tannerellaceae bacterium]|jgi:hypothetical protein|nr:cell wall-active antibiotics response protein [Tannerellaceae bacterium]